MASSDPNVNKIVMSPFVDRNFLSFGQRKGIYFHNSVSCIFYGPVDTLVARLVDGSSSFSFSAAFNTSVNTIFWPQGSQNGYFH